MEIIFVDEDDLEITTCKFGSYFKTCKTASCYEDSFLPGIWNIELHFKFQKEFNDFP